MPEKPSSFNVVKTYIGVSHYHIAKVISPIEGSKIPDKFAILHSSIYTVISVICIGSLQGIF